MLKVFYNAAKPSKELVGVMRVVGFHCLLVVRTQEEEELPPPKGPAFTETAPAQRRGVSSLTAVFGSSTAAGCPSIQHSQRWQRCIAGKEQEDHGLLPTGRTRHDVPPEPEQRLRHHADARQRRRDGRSYVLELDLLSERRTWLAC
eukprot:scaffold5962_cov331-Prasinococcus_capsulatus_cf.AAC.2